MSYVLTPRAANEVREAIRFLAAENPHAARRLREGLNAAFKLIGEDPGVGHSRPDLTALPLKF